MFWGYLGVMRDRQLTVPADENRTAALLHHAKQYARLPDLSAATAINDLFKVKQISPN